MFAGADRELDNLFVLAHTFLDSIADRLSVPAPPPAPTDRTIVSWDTALSANELSSYSACMVLQVRGETAYILNVFRERLEYPDLKRKVIELHHRWRSYTNNYALLIEKMGSGMSLIQDLRRDDIHPVPVKPKEDKVIRMNA